MTRRREQIEPKARTSVKRKASLEAAREKAKRALPAADEGSSSSSSSSSSSAAESDDGAQESGAKSGGKKRTKTVKAPTIPLDPNAPTNLTMPHSLTYDPAGKDEIKLVTWNISGHAASVKKGFRIYVEAEDPDILVLQETKLAQPLPEDDFLSQRYPHQYHSHHTKKGYAGVAVFSKIAPMNDSVTTSLPCARGGDDFSGRLVTLEFASSYLVACYAVNAGSALATLDEKARWNRAIEAYLRGLQDKKPVIWLGDLNVAHQPIDLRRPKENLNKTAGYHQDEIESFERQLNPLEDSGKYQLTDLYRHFHPERQGAYTYYSFRFQCRQKGLGWRVDYIVSSKALAERFRACEIRAEAWGASDHVPVMALLERDAL